MVRALAYHNKKMATLPQCQRCGLRAATGVQHVHTSDAQPGALALVCSDACDSPLYWTAQRAQEAYGFLVDRNVILLFKPHAGLVHQYIIYQACCLAARHLNLSTLAAGNEASVFWQRLGASGGGEGGARLTTWRFLAGLIWPDMPLARTEPLPIQVPKEAARDVRPFLAQLLTQATRDAFAATNDAFVSSVPSYADIPYLSAPDAQAFRVEPASGWSLTFGLALTLPDLFPKSVQGKNAVTLHLHSSMQVMHAMRGLARETHADALQRVRWVLEYLLERFVVERDAFFLGVLAHTLSDSFSMAHTTRNRDFPCRLATFKDFETDESSVKHASHEDEAAVFADAARGTLTEPYVELIPASIHAVAFVMWSAAHLLGQASSAGGADAKAARFWACPQNWHTRRKNRDSRLEFEWPVDGTGVSVPRIMDYLFYAYFAQDSGD